MRLPVRYVRPRALWARGAGWAFMVGPRPLQACRGHHERPFPLPAVAQDLSRPRLHGVWVQGCVPQRRNARLPRGLCGQGGVVRGQGGGALRPQVQQARDAPVAQGQVIREVAHKDGGCEQGNPPPWVPAGAGRGGHAGHSMPPPGPCHLLQAPWHARKGGVPSRA